MKAKVASVLAIGALLTFVPHAGAQAPPAREWKSAITTPTSGASTTIRISKASRASVKVGIGAVTFSLKLNGVVDTVNGDPVTLASNSFEVQFLVNGATFTETFLFDIVNGKTSPSTVKFPVANGDAGTWGSALSVGQTVEVRRVRVIEAGTGDDFGVAGITAR